MPFDDPWIDGKPSVQGLWERAYLLEALQSDSFDLMQSWAKNYYPITQFTTRNVSASWQPTYVTFREGTTYHIVLQGTENIKQVLLHCGGVAYTEPVNGGKGVRNSLWDKVASDIWTAIKPDFDSDTPIVADIYGHSYGAAVASLLGRRIQADFPGIVLWISTFGSPKPTGGDNGPFTVPFYTRVRDEGDAVPTLPPKGFTAGLVQVPTSTAFLRSKLTNWGREGTGVLLTDDGRFVTDYDDDLYDRDALTKGISVWTDRHVIYTYRTRLQAVGVTQPKSGTSDTTQAQKDAIAAQPPAPLVPDVSDPSTLASINAVYFGAGSTVVNAANVFDFESSSLTLGTPTVRRGANIGELTGSTMSLYSGYSRITMCINNGTYGRLESHSVNIAVNNYTAIKAAYTALVMKRANLLGSTQVNTPSSGKSKGNPQIQFIKVIDAFIPKQGYVVDLSNRGYFGPAPGGTPFPAEPAMVAISLRMVGTALTDWPLAAPIAAPDRDTSILVTAAPDLAFSSGDFDPGFNRGGTPYWQDLKAYLDFLTAGASGMLWGFTGLSSHQPKQPIVSWQVVTPPAPALPYFTFTTAAPGFTTGDRVRITGVAPNFNGTFSVAVDTPNNYSLKGGPATGRPIPRGGFAQKVADGATQQRFMSFYQYSTYETDPTHGVQVKVSKKDPGREYLNVSFRKRTRKTR